MTPLENSMDYDQLQIEFVQIRYLFGQYLGMDIALNNTVFDETQFQTDQ